MRSTIQRRHFLQRATSLSALAALGSFASIPAPAQGRVTRNSGTRIRLALNAYSFNAPLRDGRMTLEDVVDCCSRQDIDGLDATGYYFPGYPEAPSDEYVRKLKRRAFVNGVTIHGTGVRNDFAVADADRRKADVQLVKNWIEVAEKLGASVIRIFSGNRVPNGHSFEQALEWIAADIRECVEYGRQHGVIVALQNHHDFVKTAAETIRVCQAVDSEWFGVILDVGSLRQGDPYEEIERLLPYAVSWQLKESVWYGEKEVPIDLARVKSIIDRGGYRGFLPIETLGEGDPMVKVTRFLERVREVFSPA